MKFFTNIISTTFSSEVNTDKDVLEIAEFVVQTYAYRIKKRTNNRLIVVPYWLSFITSHPNNFVIKAELNLDNDALKFKVWHPFHLLINLVVLLFLGLEVDSLIFLISPLLLGFSLVYTIVTQRVIFKKIIKEIEK